MVSHIPRPLDLEHAGAIPTTGLTALQGVDDALHLKDGENVIIHGASGGVGSVAIQFAKLRGARVLATASSAAGMEFVTALGADMAADGRHGDIVATAKTCGPDGIDAVLGLGGGGSLEECLRTRGADCRRAIPRPAA